MSRKRNHRNFSQSVAFSGQIQFLLATSNGIVSSKIYDKRDILITHLFIVCFFRLIRTLFYDVYISYLISLARELVCSDESK